MLLVDELAHSNAPGCRHPKRWQDVVELLAAGVDVLTTVNVQHVESLNDIVGGITGIRVFETVPDPVFAEANEVVLVDLTPDDLLVRLREGKVYLPEQAERAIQNFFRKGNLIACASWRCDRPPTASTIRCGHFASPPRKRRSGTRATHCSPVLDRATWTRKWCAPQRASPLSSTATGTRYTWKTPSCNACRSRGGAPFSRL